MWWRTKGHPDDWQVLVQCSKTEDFFVYPGSTAAFVADLIEDKHDVPFLAEEEEPVTDHEFAAQRSL